MSIHPTAIVAHGAELDPTVEVGPYAIIGPKVRIGAGTRVGSHAVIDGRTTIGRDNRISPFASIGGVPQDLKYAGEDSTLEIGDANQIREYVTLHIGTAKGAGTTRIGSGCLFMASSHVAHDCVVGDHCILDNSVALAGHVNLDDHVIIGGLSGVHQFTRIGRRAFIGAASLVASDVPPYCMAQGDRARLMGLNTVGLTRAGLAPETIAKLKAAYKMLFRGGLGQREAISQLRALYGDTPEVAELLGFVEGSERGVAR